MLTLGLWVLWCAAFLATSLSPPAPAQADVPAAIRSRVEAALENMLTLDRPHQDGLATVWDGNKYVQCRRMPNRSVHCEAAGALMQPSLEHVLTPQKIARLAALGWRLDPSFGNYGQIFSPDTAVAKLASTVLQTLARGYDADLATLEVASDWIASEPCPPRNGLGQNLAGMINDAPSMAATSVHACSFKPSSPTESAASARSAADLIKLYGPRVTAEIQRLRVNLERQIYFGMDTGAGYIQCGPATAPPAIYCEAASADSMPVLSRVLVPERVARMHAVGFADPGRAPNYWKTYVAASADDATIARELLTILREVYAYDGAPPLRFYSEK